MLGPLSGRPLLEDNGNSMSLNVCTCYKEVWNHPKYKYVNWIELKCEVLQLVVQAYAWCQTLFRHLSGLDTDMSRVINTACKCSAFRSPMDELLGLDGTPHARNCAFLCAL